MPWNTTLTPGQRLKLVTFARRDRYTIGELCLEFGVSRKCEHKWLERDAAGGAALMDASRAPQTDSGASPLGFPSSLLIWARSCRAMWRSRYASPWWFMAAPTKPWKRG